MHRKKLKLKKEFPAPFAKEVEIYVTDVIESSREAFMSNLLLEETLDAVLSTLSKRSYSLFFTIKK